MYNLYGNKNTIIVSPAENRANLRVRNRKYEIERQVK